MARTIASGELTVPDSDAGSALRNDAARVRFSVATPADDSAIRRLLRDNPVRGAISVSFEREPDYFAGASLAGALDLTLVARERSDDTIVSARVIALGRCAMRWRFVNGAPCRVGYLAELRLDASVAGRADILRGGYAFLRETLAREADPPEFLFTSIAADNERARRFLERGVRGMPRYDFLGEFVTMLVPTKGRAASPLVAAAANEVHALLNAHAARHQLAARWTGNELARCGEFFGVRDTGNRLIAAASLWDQRPFRQTVVRGYSRSLALARPFMNFASALLGGARLPRPGSVLAHAFVSPLACASGSEAALVELIAALRPIAARRGIDLLTLGFAADDPRAAMIRRRFRCREYRTRMYCVSWPGDPAPTFFGGTLMPEVSLL